MVDMISIGDFEQIEKARPDEFLAVQDYLIKVGEISYMEVDGAEVLVHFRGGSDFLALQFRDSDKARKVFSNMLSLLPVANGRIKRVVEKLGGRQQR